MNAAKHAVDTEVDPFDAIEPYVDVQQAQKETTKAESNAKAVTAKSKKRLVNTKELFVWKLNSIAWLSFYSQFQVQNPR